MFISSGFGFSGHLQVNWFIGLTGYEVWILAGYDGLSRFRLMQVLLMQVYADAGLT